MFPAMRKPLRWVARAALLLSFGATFLFGQAESNDQNHSNGEAVSAKSSLQPVRLRCEFAENPVGVESLHPRLSWILQATGEGRRGLRQTAYEILVASSSVLLAKDQSDAWDSGRVASPDFIQIEYRGKPPQSTLSYFWKVRVWDQDGHASAWSQPTTWTMGLLAPSDWKAKWIAAEPDSGKSGPGVPSVSNRAAPAEAAHPLPIFRHEFHLARAPQRAAVYVSGLGQYELRLNGEKVSDDVLTPGWTDYRKRVLYNSYDVTSLLKSGGNAFGVLLGNGMYNVPKTPGRYTKFNGSFGEPKLILQLHVTYADGSEQVVASDASWKTTAGPITFSNTYGGEDYDARRQQPGWDARGFDDSSWASALEVAGPGGKLVSQRIPPIKVMQTYPAARITEPEPGVLVYDLGQNFSGRPEIKVTGPAGSTVRLIPGELLDANGLVTQRSSGGPTWFSYTLRGSGEETWHPRFTYYGFRYVQVEGARGTSDPSKGNVLLLSLTGQFTHLSAEVDGKFSSSDKLLDGIHKLIDAAILSNMQSVLTDCPHREKLGWLEESHLLASSIMYNYGVARLYEKIANDMADAQHADGFVADIAPEYVVFEKGFLDSPEWGSASVLGPWIAYQHYGDQGILADHYSLMKSYVDYLTGRAKDHIISYGLGDWYDIGPKEPGESQLTSRGITATAIYYLDLTVVQKVALLLGKPSDAAAYGKLAEEVRDAFNKNFFHPDSNQYDQGSQTADAMPLAAGLVPEEKRHAVLESLVRDIRKHNNHVTAGDIGFHFVVEALTQGGRSDVLFDMLSRTDSPSYGYQLQRGATSLTEAWDTNPHSSQNHFMLGHAEEWFYRGLAGIDFDLSRAKDEQIVIKPFLPSNVASAEASYESVLGKIVSSWKKSAGSVTLEVTIPAGATAKVVLPTTNPEAVRESGVPWEKASGVHTLNSADGALACEVSSGVYHFQWPE